MTDARYFTTQKKGEIFELKAELNSPGWDKKKEAVKKVIAAMTVGKDVSGLFPDVINCMQTNNLELKKLVYLYCMNYAKTQPELAIMPINTFRKDCQDHNPLIRALAVRTMGCIRVEEITEYLCDPLHKCLKDEDPYVRKTAAVTVAKLYDINPSLVQEQGFIEALKDLISDSNPMVVANAVAALSEINDTCDGEPLIPMTAQTINKLLTALNECSEWGQVFILDCLSTYTPRGDREAQSICERINPRLAHANAAVVLSTVKVLMKYMQMHQMDNDFVQGITKKLAPPLVTLLSAEHEVQYVALKNISLIIQKRPEILKHEVRVFFVKYNDPIYVKLEKLNIMIKLANHTNMSQVLAELKEYATEVDVDFVRKAVRAIGRCAIKIEQSAEKCVATLLQLIETNVNYVVQEAIVVIKDIFRKYPNKYEGVIGTLCENLDTLDEPEARASMIWIIGEYAERIDNANELLESFLDNFNDENGQVQLQILTAIVKLFLKKPAETQELVQQVLALTTQDTENPDLRDRGFIYWRLLSTDPTAAKEVVLAEKPLINEESDQLPPTMLDELICHISSLASVYHKPPSTFISGAPVFKRVLNQDSFEQEALQDVIVTNTPAQPAQPSSLIGDLLDIGIGDPVSNPIPSSSQGSNYDILGDILGGGPTTPQQNADLGFGGGNMPTMPMANDPLGDFMSDMSFVTTGISSSKETWLNSVNGKGFQIMGSFSRRQGQVIMELEVTNKSPQQMNNFGLQLNKNSFGLIPTQQLNLVQLAPNETANVSVPLGITGPVQKMEPLNNLQVAVKNNLEVFYFSCLVPAQMLFSEDGQMDKQVFLATWKEIPDQNEAKFVIQNANCSTDTLTSKTGQNNIFTVAKRNENGKEIVYQTVKFSNNCWALMELAVAGANVELCVRARAIDVSIPIHQAYEAILKA